MGARALTARGQLGEISRRHKDQPELVVAARRDLAAAKIADYIERTVAAAPALSAEQRSKLAVLLLNVGGGHDATG